MKPTICIIHFNKQAQKWSVHNKKTCHIVDHIKIEVPTETRERPRKRSNPRFFIVCKGYLKIQNNTATIQSRPK